MGLEGTKVGVVSLDDFVSSSRISCTVLLKLSSCFRFLELENACSMPNISTNYSSVSGARMLVAVVCCSVCPAGLRAINSLGVTGMVRQVVERVTGK